MRFNYACAVQTQFSGLPGRGRKASKMSPKIVTFGTHVAPFWDISTEKSEKKAFEKGV